MHAIPRKRRVVVRASIPRMPASSYMPKRSMRPAVWTNSRVLPAFTVPISTVLRGIAGKSPWSEERGRYPKKFPTALILWYRSEAEPRSLGRSNKGRTQHTMTIYVPQCRRTPDQERLQYQIYSTLPPGQYGALHCSANPSVFVKIFVQLKIWLNSRFEERN